MAKENPRLIISKADGKSFTARLKAGTTDKEAERAARNVLDANRGTVTGVQYRTK